MKVRHSSVVLSAAMLCAAACSRSGEHQSSSTPPGHSAIASNALSLQSGYDSQAGAMVVVSGAQRDRAADVSIERLWRYDPPANAPQYVGTTRDMPVGHWVEIPIQRPPAPESVRLPVNGRGVALASLAGAPLSIGTYAMRGTLDGTVVRATFHNGPIHCNDIAIGTAPPGLHAMCIAMEHGAMAVFVPDVPSG